MTFANTTDPNVLTADDVARWCNELATLIRENPSNPKMWLERSHLLYRKIEAISKIYVENKPDPASAPEIAA